MRRKTGIHTGSGARPPVQSGTVPAERRNGVHPDRADPITGNPESNTFQPEDLTMEHLEKILNENNKKVLKRVVFADSTIYRYFPPEESPQEIKEKILQMLKDRDRQKTSRAEGQKAGRAEGKRVCQKETGSGKRKGGCSICVGYFRIEPEGRRRQKRRC